MEDESCGPSESQFGREFKYFCPVSLYKPFVFETKILLVSPYSIVFNWMIFGSGFCCCDASLMTNKFVKVAYSI